MREIPQQQRVDDAEDGRIDADPQAERQHDRRRKTGALLERAQRVTQVLKNGVHHRVPSYSARKATTGSIRVVARAGMRLASADTTIRNAVTATSVAKSVGVTS